MLSKYLRHAVLAATLLDLAIAQKSDIVPQEFQTGFLQGSTEMQASYTGQAQNGFDDGTTFEKDEVSKEPTFALGDSSGVSPTPRYTLLMIDTTCDDARILHFARTNYRYNFEIVKIETDTAPVLEYKAPGAFGETGDDRKYSFLMYDQPNRKEISSLKLPEEGKPFDIKKFQSDNGFKDPTAGVGMVVKLGGQSSCDGSQPNPGVQSSSASEQPEQASSTTSAQASSTSSAQASSTPSSASRASSVSVSVIPTPSESEDSASTTTVPSQTADDNESPVATSEASGQTTDLVPTTSIVQNGTASATADLSTLLPSSVAPNGNASLTSTGGPAQQTTSDASGMSSRAWSCAVLVSMFAFAGLLVL